LEDVILAGLFRQHGKHKSAFLPKLLILVPTLLIPLFAIQSTLASAAEDISSTNQEIGNLEARSQELGSDYQQALSDLVAVDSEVTRYSSQIDDTNQRRADIQASIAAEQSRLDEYQAQLSDREGALEKRLRSSYKSNEVSYLEVVMGAGDFSDFLNRVDMVNLIADEDRQLIESIEDAKNGLQNEINSLSDMQNQLAGTIEELSAAQSNLIDAQARQQGFVSSLQSQKLATDGQLAQMQAEAASIEARMNQIQQEADSSADSGGSWSDSPPAGGGASFTVESTAYCLGGTTATGMPVGRGIIAVDPSVIPLGSRVHVSGYGDAIAADTGGAIQGNIIDVWLPCGEAYSWGRRSVTITVY